MSNNIIEAFSNLVSPEIANQASKALGESTGGITSALNSAVPTLLGSLMSQTSSANGSAKIFQLINGANVDSEILSNMAGLFAGGDRSNALISDGINLLSGLLGNSVNALVSALATISRIKLNSAGSLLAMAAPMLFAFLKKLINEQGLNAASFATLLSQQRPALEKAGLDGHILGAIGVSTLGGSVGGVGSSATNARSATDLTASSGGSISIKWLPGIVGLILLFLLLRACTTTNKVAAPPTASPAATPSAPAAIEGLPAKIYFEAGKAQLDDENKRALDAAIRALSTHPSLKVTLSGYVDSSGSADVNAELAKQRAFAVRGALTAGGIAEDRITLAKPADVAGAAPGDREGRRVEINVQP